MGKIVYFINTLSFSPWAHLVAWLHLGTLKKLHGKVNIIITLHLNLELCVPYTLGFVINFSNWKNNRVHFKIQNLIIVADQELEN
jgi:hypothetical protein